MFSDIIDPGHDFPKNPGPWVPACAGMTVVGGRWAWVVVSWDGGWAVGSRLRGNDGGWWGAGLRGWAVGSRLRGNDGGWARE